jgi:hypothetical protein
VGVKFFDAVFFSLIGFGAHLAEDALVYNPGWKILWPLSSHEIGFGLFPGVTSGTYGDFFGIAETEVLIVGLVLLLAAIIIRTWADGSFSWIRWYMPGSLYTKFFAKKQEPSAP